MTQTMLGQALGISFQQIQKYERGDSVIPATRLYALSRLLGCPYEEFYAGFEAALPDIAAPRAVHPAIMSRALKIQYETAGAARTKLLKIIDIMSG